MVLDFVCVDSYLGFTRLLRAVRRRREDGGEVAVRFRPYRLRPEASPAGEPLFEQHRRERGEEFARLVASDTTLGKADGVVLDFSRAIFTNTFDAHLLLTRAAELGRGEEMAKRLYRAYFAEGRHIADQATLDDLAAEANIGPDSGSAAADRIAGLHADLERVRGSGVTVVPVYRFDSGLVLTGDQSEETLREALREPPRR